MHFSLNGELRDCRELPGELNLLSYLRTTAGLTSVKNGCGYEVCGTCTVLVEGIAHTSCSRKNTRGRTKTGKSTTDKESASVLEQGRG